MSCNRAEGVFFSHFTTTHSDEIQSPFHNRKFKICSRDTKAAVVLTLSVSSRKRKSAKKLVDLASCRQKKLTLSKIINIHRRQRSRSQTHKCEMRVLINKKRVRNKKTRQFFRPKHFLVCDIMRDIFALRWESMCVWSIWFRFLLPFVKTIL